MQVAFIHTFRQVFSASIRRKKGISVTELLTLLVTPSAAFVLKMDDREFEGNKPVLDSNFKSDCVIVK
jgi:hypothetical protein